MSTASGESLSAPTIVGLQVLCVLLACGVLFLCISFFYLSRNDDIFGDMEKGSATQEQEAVALRCVRASRGTTKQVVHLPGGPKPNAPERSASMGAAGTISYTDEELVRIKNYIARKQQDKQLVKQLSDSHLI
ncbi:hypothetical protein VKT23_008607 [Stygiomarasmius scandens]|uniref:Uncharacterized protein n=1 Tax=Marasmiellus scandens TaxID=2682957 RepID=A0ABR1JJG0_9AGAR